MSRIGKAPITVPSGVDVSIAGRTVTVKGPKGTLARDIPGEIVVRKEDTTIFVERPNDERQNRALHGLSRTLVSNMVVGVTDKPPVEASAWAARQAYIALGMFLTTAAMIVPEHFSRPALRKSRSTGPRQRKEKGN